VCQRDRIGFNKQVTNSDKNVIILYSTVHVISCVHPKYLLSDSANNPETILVSCWFILTRSKHQWTVRNHLWYRKFKNYFQYGQGNNACMSKYWLRKDAFIVNYWTLVPWFCSWIENVPKIMLLYMTQILQGSGGGGDSYWIDFSGIFLATRYKKQLINFVFIFVFVY
jgi:hypothetical protein